MAYIQGGELKPKRSMWRPSIITDVFWMIVFYVRVFWKTLFSMDESNAYGRRGSDQRRRPGGFGGSGGGGGGGWGGGGGGAPPPGTPGTGSTPKRFNDMSSLRGTDHNAPCSSCCGG